MLKLFFFLLVLGNGALFAYQQGHLELWFSSGREPSRMAKQIQPQSVKLLSSAAPSTTTTTQPAAPAVAPAATPETPATVEQTAALAQKPGTETKPGAETKLVQLACLEIGNFAAADATRFETQMASLNLGPRLVRQASQDGSGFMVFMPPQGSKENADKKVAQLRALGVTDFFVMQENNEMRWAISLGLFTTEQAAKARLAKLAEQGVRTARIGPHSGVPKIYFQVKDLDATTKEKVEKIHAAFPQQQSRACGSVAQASAAPAQTP